MKTEKESMPAAAKTEKREYLMAYVAVILAFVIFSTLVNSFFLQEDEYWHFFYMFTHQSNVIVMLWLLFFGLSVFCGLEKIRKFITNKAVMSAVTVYISITYFIVLLVLNPIYGGQYDAMANGAEFMLHNGAAFVMWIYFFLVKGNGGLKWYYAFYILIYPLVYVSVNLIVGYSAVYDGEAAFAYGFINPESYSGIFVYILALLLLTAVFTAFGLGLMKLKGYINKKYHGE